MRKLIISEEEQKHIKNLYKINEIDAEKVVTGLFQMAQDYASGKRGGMETTSDDSEEKTDYSDEPSSSTGDNWMDVTRKVIKEFEGGYWNPECAKYPGSKHPTKTGMYKRSGETMFGLDREAGNIENVSSDGKKFFEVIDNEKRKLGMDEFCRVWKWNYIPSDPLKSELIDLAAKTMKSLYEKNANNYFKGKTRNVVENSKPLLLHFSYATWNGPGFFKKFANTINQAIEQGKPMKELIQLAKNDRTEKLGGAWAQATQKVNRAIDSEATSEGLS